MGDRRVALLRGVNVGKAKRIAMGDLRAIIEGLGHTRVATLLNSGNAAYTAADSDPREDERAIEAGIVARCGFFAKTTVVPLPELEAILDSNPLADVATDPSRLLVSILNQREDAPAMEAFAAQDWSPDRAAVVGRAGYIWCAEGILASRLADAANRRFKELATSRNWATMQKLLALAKT